MIWQKYLFSEFYCLEAL